MLKQMIDRVWSGGTSPHDSEIYELIHKELSAGTMDAGLWTKATAVSDGNAEKAKARYIEMRANALRNERKKLLEFAKQAQRAQREVEKHNAEREKRYAELQSLKSRETSIRSKLWLEFTSPEAKKAKRKKQLRNTLIFAAASSLAYYLLKEESILLIFFGFFFWLASLATYGKYELEKELDDITRRIKNLG